MNFENENNEEFEIEEEVSMQNGQTVKVFNTTDDIELYTFYIKPGFKATITMEKI